MSEYQFEMADDGTHARVLVDGNVIGTIQNTPDYLGGGLNFGSDGSRHHPHPMPGDEMWDAFDVWIDAKSPAQEPGAQQGQSSAREGAERSEA